MNTLDKNIANKHLSNLFHLDANGDVQITRWNDGDASDEFVFFTLKDFGLLSIETVHDLFNVIDFNDPSVPEWFITRWEINYEDTDLWDDHTARHIPYAVPID